MTVVANNPSDVSALAALRTHAACSFRTRESLAEAPLMLASCMHGTMAEVREVVRTMRRYTAARKIFVETRYWLTQAESIDEACDTAQRFLDLGCNSIKLCAVSERASSGLLTS